MINLHNESVYLLNGNNLIFNIDASAEQLKNKLGQKTITKEKVKQNTITYSILQNHNKSENYYQQVMY